LFSVLPHDRSGRLEANTDSTALINEGTLGGNSPDDILRGQYPRHPGTNLRPTLFRSEAATTAIVHV
jgi:hypothetical protein